MPKQYRPGEHEGRIRARWESSGAFHADPGRVLRGKAEPYCILIPPPNVTAALHLGHALNNTLQDVLVRAHRMMGFETLWMPGTDHAGIATQAVVEKRLRAEGVLKGPLKQGMKREDFVARVQAFKDEYEATITGQLKAMGCSCDWARQRFTMDPVCVKAVYEAFFRLFKDGLIYRGKRLVNWDPALQTAVADDETEDIEVDGQMYYLRYPLVHQHGAVTQKELSRGKGAPEDAVPVSWSELRARGWPEGEDSEHEDEKQAWVTVATTRPETYLGDTAVAVNPKDPRAKALRGLSVELPLVGRVIPIVEDAYVVLPASMQEDAGEAAKDPKAAIATGFLKVTPAHDPNDYELGQRHKLPLINVMAPDATISDKHGWTDVGGGHVFVGKSREEARKLVIKEFKAHTVGGDPAAATLFAKAIPYRHSVPHSDRSKAAIEPYLSDQWYVKVTDERMAPAANRALVQEQRTSSVREHGSDSSACAEGSSGDGSLRFHPARYAKTYETWHDNIRDWCISRQLWWGHRIPVWHFCLDDREAALAGVENVRNSSEASERARSQLPGPVSKVVSRVLSESAPVSDGAALARYELGDFFSFVGIAVGAELSISIGPSADRGVHLCCGDRLSEDTLALLRECRELGDRGSRVQAIRAFVRRVSKVDDASSTEQFIGSAADSAGVVAKLYRSWERDPDVLDTWFSSALWPISTMGWPEPPVEMKGLLEAYNPSSTLCTAREIITLWVSRMVMFNRYFRGQDLGQGPGNGPLPYRGVFVHSVIQDGEGRKMSKSLNNGVDPLDIIESHGADAMRYTMVKLTTQTQDVRLPVTRDPTTGKNTSAKFDEGRNFCNKLWNAARFAIGILEQPSDEATKRRSDEGSRGSLVDRWMLSRLAVGVEVVDSAIREFQFSDYAQTVYDLLWRDFCDWYLEAIKPTVAGDPFQRAVLRHALETIVRLLHPIAPFVTEAIWERLGTIQTAAVPGVEIGPARKAGLLCTAGWPRVDPSLRDAAAEAEFERVRGLVTAIREMRAQHNVPPKRRVTLHLPRTMQESMRADLALVQGLAGVEAVTTESPKGAAVAFAFESVQCQLSNMADAVDAGAERNRLEKSIADLTRAVDTFKKRLANPGYADKAPPAMVQQTRDQLAKAEADLAAATAGLKGLQ